MLIVKLKQRTHGCLLYYSFCMFENFNRKVTQSMLWALVENWLQQTLMALLLQSDRGPGTAGESPVALEDSSYLPGRCKGASQQLGRLRPASRAGLKSQLLLGDRQLSISSAVVAKGLWCPANPRVGSNSDTMSLVSSSADVWLLDLEGEKIP